MRGKKDPKSKYYRSAQAICKTIIRDLKPKSVLDLGCGACNFSNALNKEKCRVVAVDGSEHAKKMADKGVKVICADLSCKLKAGKDFDLVLCLEVIEHIDQKYEDIVLRNIVLHTRKYAVVTAANTGQGGIHHVNCKPKEYWVKRFSDMGLLRHESMENRWREEWKKAKVQGWYERNLMIWERPPMKMNSPEWCDMKAIGYINAGDFRDHVKEFTEAAKLIKGPVMEIGSAFGELVNHLAPGVRYVGLDISPRSVTVARERHPEHIFVLGNILKFGHKWRNTFETICAFQILEHFPSVATVIEKLKEVARSRIIFSVPRGLPSGSAKKHDGHLIGWEDEEALIKDFSRFGNVSIWKGQDNHICGVLKW